MTWIGIGEFSLGGVVPLAGVIQGRLSAAVGLVLPELESKLDGVLRAQAALILNPPSLSAQLAAAESIVTQLTALLNLGIPGASVDLVTLAALVAELQLQIGGIQAHATFATDFGVLLGTPGVYLVRHTGPVGDVMPGGLPGGIGPLQPVEGIAILATDAGAWTAIQALFRVS